MARPAFLSDEVPAEGSEEAQRLQEAAAEVEGLADAFLERLRTLAQARCCAQGMRGAGGWLVRLAASACGPLGRSSLPSNSGKHAAASCAASAGL